MFWRPPFLCVSFACLYGIGCDGGKGIFSVISSNLREISQRKLGISRPIINANANPKERGNVTSQGGNERGNVTSHTGFKEGRRFLLRRPFFSLVHFQFDVPLEDFSSLVFRRFLYSSSRSMKGRCPSTNLNRERE